jgi:protein ImuB
MSNVESQSSNLRPSTFDLRPNVGPDSLFLDITGIGVLFGGEDCLAREILKDVRRLGYEARAAIADTIGAGWAAASEESSRFKVQGSKFCFRAFEPTLNFELGTLNLAALRLPRETIDLLTQLGIRQVSDLLALPRESLKARFGERLILRIDQLLGTAQETIVAYRPPPQFAEEWLLEYPVEGRETIERIVEELVRRIARALAERREGVVRLVCRLDCAPGQPLFLQIGLFRPSADARHLWELVRMHLERAALTGALGRVRLEAVLTAKLENRQGLLFAGDEQEAAGQFAQLIDRFSSRLGPRAVLQPELTADPLPEKAVRYRVGLRVQGSGSKQFKVQSSRFKVSDRRRAALNFELGTLNLGAPPLALYSPPIPISAVSIAPDGPPMFFEWAGQRHQVVHQSGPERIETGWWRGKSVRRDYWRVETTTGERFWLFRHLESGRWNLHGAYA